MGGSSSDSTVKYADYWQSVHADILNHTGADKATESMIGAFNAALGQSPYGEAASINVRGGFFSTGYTVEDFPSLWSAG